MIIGGIGSVIKNIEDVWSGDICMVSGVWFCVVDHSLRVDAKAGQQMPFLDDGEKVLWKFMS